MYNFGITATYPIAFDYSIYINKLNTLVKILLSEESMLHVIQI